MMGIASCPNLTFRVHPFCKHRGGGLVQDTREDREALQDCKVKNNIATKTKSNKSKSRTFKRKSKKKKGRKRKNRKSRRMFKKRKSKRKRKRKRKNNKFRSKYIYG